MKKINSRKALNFSSMLLIISIAMFFVGCNPKKDPLPTPAPPAPPVEPPAKSPVFTSYWADTAWYNDTTTIKWTADYASDGFIVGNEEVYTGATSRKLIGLKATTVVTVKAKGPGGITPQTITVPVWSENITYICKYGSVYIYKNLLCMEDSIAFPYAYKDVTTKNMPTDVFTYKPDGTGFIKIGPYGPNAGGTFILPRWWTLPGNQLSDGAETWIIDSIGTWGFDIYKVRDIINSNPVRKIRTIFQYRHPK